MIALIAAINKKYGIGRENELLYDIPEDKKLFRENHRRPVSKHKPAVKRLNLTYEEYNDR